MSNDTKALADRLDEIADDKGDSPARCEFFRKCAAALRASPVIDRDDERFVVAIPRTFAEQGALEHDPLEWTADYLDDYARVNSSEAGTAYMEDAAEVLRLVASARASSGEPEQGAAPVVPHTEACEHSRDCIACGKRIESANGLCFSCAVSDPKVGAERARMVLAASPATDRGDERQKRGAARIRAADKFLNGLVDEMDDLLARGVEPPGTFIGGAARGHVHGWYDCLAALGYDDERVDALEGKETHHG